MLGLTDTVSVAGVVPLSEVTESTVSVAAGVAPLIKLTESHDAGAGTLTVNGSARFPLLSAIVCEAGTGLPLA